MLNRFFLGICFWAGCFSTLFAQGQEPLPIYYQSFDEGLPIAPNLNSTSLFLFHTPTLSEGLEGRALDLTDEVAYRIPLALEKGVQPAYGEKQSFALEVWVRTKPGAAIGTPIVTNSTEKDPRGWCLGTRENGAWYLRVHDGKGEYRYEPTAERQAINDGRWHQLVFSVDREHEELRMYLDGRNVAIYHTPGLGSLEGSARTIVGGSDEEQDWECRGEWMAFNGKVDEVKLWDRPLTNAEVRKSYARFFPLEEPLPAYEPDRLKVQVWNIWHGGRRFGKQVGVNRVIDVLKGENADVIGLVETYGSGAIIADSLGYYFYLISSNLSILSRYPIEETIRLFRPFNAGGAVIRLSETQQIAFYDVWLHYLPDISTLHKGKEAVRLYEKEEQKTRLPEIRAILEEMQPRIARADETPVILVGDFNCDSHLDWTSKTEALHRGIRVDLPVSQAVQQAGFTDSFRHLYPDVLLNQGATWSPLLNMGADSITCLPQRIDFIYYQGDKLVPYRSERLEHYPKGWPSDHGSVVTEFYLKGK